MFMPPEDLPEGTRDAEQDEAELSAQAVYELVARLPTEERIAFTLRFVEGMTNGEIATVMGCSGGTVKRRISRAKTRFFALAEKHPELASLCSEREVGP